MFQINQMTSTRNTFLIFGISKGLGKAIALSLPSNDDIVFGVSRTQPEFLDSKPNIHWISADLSSPMEATQSIKKRIGTRKIDYFIYNVGIWESNGFTDNYSFDTVSPDEIVRIVQTNLTSCILSIQVFIENLQLSRNPKVVFIGSTWGLENHQGKEVAFSATKFGLRGAIHALRTNLRHCQIGVSILNLGYLATEFDISTPTQEVLATTNGQLIPLADVINALKFIMSTSNASCVKEINMPAMQDPNI